MNMEYIILVFLCMIFLHIFADFNLQRGAYLADMKQKKFWKEYIGKEYKADYSKDWSVAMTLHCFVWSFAIMLPLIIYYGGDLGYIWVLLPINMIVHFYIDDLKANKLKINLIQDQALHMIQIIVTFVLCLIVLG